MSLNTYPNNPFPPSTEQMHRGDNEELQAQIDAIKDGATIDSFGDVETALATKTDNAVIAPEFDAEAGIYSVGDLVMHEGKLYEFTSAHETAGDWNSEEVSEKTVADEIDSLKSGLTNVSRNNFGYGVNVTGYNTEGNQYTFPDDGYLVGFIGNDEILVKILGATSTANIEALLNTGVAVSVRKGMRFYIDTNTAGKLVAFVPFA